MCLECVAMPKRAKILVGQNEFHYAYSEGNLAALMLVLGGISENKAGSQLGIKQSAVSHRLTKLDAAGFPAWLKKPNYQWPADTERAVFSSVKAKHRQKLLKIITSMVDLRLPLMSSNDSGTASTLHGYQRLIRRHIVNPFWRGEAKKFTGNATLLLGCFLNVVECQGFPEAAEEMNITPDAVLGNIRLLRNVIGDPLVFTRKGIAYLTAPIGQQAYDIAFKYFARLNKLQKLIEKINADPALCAANNELQNAPATTEATRG